MRGLVRTVVLVAAMAFATTASAQNYPSGPVKLIVPVPAGGVTDVMARIVGQRLQELWGQTVVVENRPGGNYGVGAQAVERAPADGLTLLVAPDLDLHREPGIVLQADLRSGRLHPDRGALPRDPDVDGEPVSAGEVGVGARRLRQGQSGQAQLWLLRHRHLRSPQHGGSQATHRDGHPARSVSAQPLD